MEIPRKFECPICNEIKPLRTIKICSKCDNYICYDCHNTLMENDKVKCPHCRNIEIIKASEESLNLECCSCYNTQFDINDPIVNFIPCPNCPDRLVCSDCYTECECCEEIKHTRDIFKNYSEEVKTLNNIAMTNNFKLYTNICKECYPITIKNYTDNVKKSFGMFIKELWGKVTYY